MIIKEGIDENMVKSYAIYSDSKKYRYLLRKIWDPKGNSLLFLGLNPSPEKENLVNNTIARVISYAKRENFGSVTICNIFSYRAVIPNDLKKTVNPIGKSTDKIILEEADKADNVLLGWGNHASFLERGKKVLELIENKSNKLYCLGLTKSLEPKHPLYLKKEEVFKKLKINI